ncbi:Magnesium and cobalt efflux protein CorC [Pontiella desulfatans]|uniref:Magnesium and cobalt efflux protein CorC n=2 Tax=Pontiella desulfatans TaxID=2750659 RepID=A0A6C2U5E3_PONDE|nr:Magnesium and cobalt efflux protein CorC [Pontiella desulfatans]
MAVLLCCSAFFSGTETALFSLSREQVKELRAHGHQVERLLALLSDNPAGLLIAILFGNLVVNILFFSMSAVLSLEIGTRYGDWWQAVVGIVVLLVVILAGEILPKAIGISFPERAVRLSSVPLMGWFHFMGPVRRVLEAITRKMEPSTQHDEKLNADELKMLIDATHHDPTFGKQEKAIVEDIVNLPEIRVRELMVPRVEQLFRRADAPSGEALAEAAEQEVDLIPIYEEDEDNIVGVVEVRDLFVNTDPSRSLVYFSNPVAFVPETKRADEMLREFLAGGHRMVCVVNEYGGLAGTVCMEDLLEEVVGEFDVLDVPAIEQLGVATYRLPGNLGIREWRSLFVGFLPDEAMRDLALDTVSGLVVSLLKRMPAAGDVARLGNLRFTVEQVRSRRIETVLLELVPEENGGTAQ